MNRLGPKVRLQSNVLHYIPQEGMAELPPLVLHPLLALVLARFDRGETNEQVAAWLAGELVTPVESMNEIVNDARLCFRAHFKNDNGRSYVDADTAALLTRLPRGASFRARDVVFPRDRALFPLTLQWLVTRYCNRRCVYCYAAPKPGVKAKDAELTHERMRQVIREAARLGAHTFFLTGGEPLLRDDAYDLIAEALAAGMTPEVITKQFIPDAAVDRLADAGMPRIYLSIDALEPALARRMTGVVHFAREIGRTIERLVERKIPVYAKCVLTSENIEHVAETVASLEALGVKWVGLVVYSRTHDEGSNDRLMPAHEQLLRLRDWCAAFAAEGHAIKVAFSYDPDAIPPAGLGPDRFVCHNGTTSLLVLPDGRVSRCDKRLPGTELVVGDLKTQSVYEAWNSAEMLASMKPPREWYAGTLCFDCDLFDVCHERGRCWYDASLTSGTLYGPQRNCPYIANSGTVGC
ncbi:MAG TPA: radical SAM protein [Thermoanaerobaculia bacterium]